MGVTWMLRPTAEGPRVVQHGGDLSGQHSGFLMVPDKRYAIIMLTNSDGGPLLLDDLFADDWALRRFAGVSSLPAVPLSLSPSELAAYESPHDINTPRIISIVARPPVVRGEIKVVSTVSF